MTEQITLERMGNDACAIGHLENGKTVFVAGGAPGDMALVEVTEEKAAFARARIVELREASPLRVSLACPFADRCGGCPWQHLSYDAQLSAKRENVVAALIRIAHFDPQIADELVKAPLGSKREWGYRNKLELSALNDSRGHLSLGFCAEGSHELTFVERCPLANRLLEKSPKALRGALRYLQGNSDLGIFRVGVRGSIRTKDLEIALWTKPSAFPRAAAAKTLRNALPQASSIVRVLADPGKSRAVKKVEVLYGKGMWEERLSGNTFFTSAPSFFQVNTAQAEKLVEQVVEGLENVKGLLIGDLYAGGGTFSIPLAKAGAQVIAIEVAGSSVRDLRRNAQINNADIDVIGDDAARALKEIGGLDALVVDPPRAGLADGVVEDIAAAAPARIAYVSCNPTTWARDVARFEANGYALRSVQPVDLFPQTFHVETVVLMSRVNK